MTTQDRDGIRHTIGHLVGLAIEGIGADANSVSAENEAAAREGRALKPEEAARNHADAAKVRDAVRAGGNLLCGLLCDLNRIADAADVLASPPRELSIEDHVEKHLKARKVREALDEIDKDQG